ncbi:MAG TPA: hypothetical protein VLX28_00445 [Thermoanaerobaculia bacterium]|nr:hypothetical protein [Thermoanaerobaculia bacterium]
MCTPIEPTDAPVEAICRSIETMSGSIEPTDASIEALSVSIEPPEGAAQPAGISIEAPPGDGVTIWSPWFKPAPA